MKHLKTTLREDSPPSIRLLAIPVSNSSTGTIEVIGSVPFLGLRLNNPPNQFLVLTPKSLACPNRLLVCFSRFCLKDFKPSPIPEKGLIRYFLKSRRLEKLLKDSNNRCQKLLAIGAGFSTGVFSSCFGSGDCFLGLGVKAPTAEWGVMMNEARKVMFSHPELMFAPGIAIIIIVLAFNFLSDAIQLAIDPKLSKQQGRQRIRNGV